MKNDTKLRPKARWSTDQAANHALLCACRRLSHAFGADPMVLERARGEVVEAMAKLTEELGLVDEANALRSKLPEFDGRHIEK